MGDPDSPGEGCACWSPAPNKHCEHNRPPYRAQSKEKGKHNMAHNRISVAVFDMIETVFSLETVREAIIGCGLAAGDLETWFAFGLRDAFALDTTGQAEPFPDILRAALDQLLALRYVQAEASARDAVLAAFSELKPHPDAHEAFAMLQDAGVPIIALSNGPKERTQQMLQCHGLSNQVQHVLSVQSVGRFKPHSAVYQHAVDTTGLPPDAHCMVACHPWDTHGAKCAGMQTAFVRRNQAYPSTMRAPDIIGRELVDVAQCIIDRSRGVPA